MTTPAISRQPCRLYLPDGTPLASGLVFELTAWPGGQRVMLVVERPYRFLQECLLGGRNRLSFSCDGGPCRPATVEQIVFYHGIGRVCILHVPDASVDCPVQ